MFTPHGSVSVIPIRSISRTNDAADTDMPPLGDHAPSLHPEHSPGGGGYPPSNSSGGCGGGDVITVLDLPDTFIIGYDSVSLTVKSFSGVKNVPPGAHFIWVAPPDGMSTRFGAWVWSSGHADAAHVMQWDRVNEVLVGSSSSCDSSVDGGKMLSYHDPVGGGGAGTMSSSSDSDADLRIWRQLAGSISSLVLDRITGRRGGGGVWFVDTADRVRGSAVMAAEAELDKHVSQSFLQQTQELAFTFPQLSKTFSTGHTGVHRTLEATDATPYIVSMLSSSSSGDDDDDGLLRDDDIVVGELQFAFLVGMHLGNESCIQQWWHVVLKLVLRAYLLPRQRPALAAALLDCIAAQLAYSMNRLETSILDYSEAQTNELRLALMIYRRRLGETLTATTGAEAWGRDEGGQFDSLAHLAVSSAFKRIEAVVGQQPLEWDLRGESYLRQGRVQMEDGEEVDVSLAELEAEDERGEWAPTVVDLDEFGKERGLVSWSD